METATLRCNCSHVPPTMPTCRDQHLPTCPLATGIQFDGEFYDYPAPPPGVMEQRRERAIRNVLGLPHLTVSQS